MASRPGKRRVRRIIIALGVLVILGGLAAIYLPTYRRRGSLDRRLSAFGANPCQKTADALIDLLDEDDVTQEQATEILKALLQPKVVVEDSYVTGQSIKIKVEQKNPIKVGNPVGFFSTTLFVEGVIGQDGHEDSASLEIAPELYEGMLVWFDLTSGPSGTSFMPDYFFPVSPPIRIQKAGTYKGKVRLSYNFAFFAFSKDPSALERILTKLGLSKSQPPKDPLSNFKYSYEIPFQIHVVAPKPTDSNPSALPAR